jgi:hypothetical protein
MELIVKRCFSKVSVLDTLLSIAMF